MMSAPTIDPVFEALGLSNGAIKGTDWMTGAGAAHAVDPFGVAPNPYAAWPPAAWCMYAEAAAAAAAAASVNAATPPAASMNAGAPLLLPEVLPAEKPKAPGTKTDATGADAEVASVASTSPGSHQLWSSPLPWGNTTAWYSSSSSDTLSSPVKADATSESKNSSEAAESSTREETDKPSPIGTPVRSAEANDLAQVEPPPVMLSTPPPKTSFRADAPTFVPAEPFPFPAAKAPASPTKSINLFECLNASPPAKLPTSPSGTPVNLFDCLRSEWSTPQNTKEANVDFLESRSKMMRIRCSMEAELKEIPEFKLSTVPAGEVAQEREAAKAVDGALSSSDPPGAEGNSAIDDGSGGKGGGKVASRSRIRANAAAARAAGSA